MERLTKRDRGGNAHMDCDRCDIRYREGCCSTKLCMNLLIDRLASYEDAEEQGLLVHLPCAVDSPYYTVEEFCNEDDEEWENNSPRCPVCGAFMDNETAIS